MPATYPTTSLKLKVTSQPGTLGPIFDLELGADGGPQLVEDSAQLCQAERTALLMVRGEAWENPGRGMPWLDLKGMKPPNSTVFRIELLNELRKEPRIREVTSILFSEDIARRELSATAYAKAVDGSSLKVEI